GVTFAVTQSTTGVLTVSWDIHQGVSVVACGDVDGDTVTIFTQTNPGGPIYFDTFFCTAHTGTTLPLPVGNYSRVTARLYDSIGEPLAQVALGPVTITPDGDADVGTAHFQIPAAFGRILVTWDITRGGFTATCEDVGAATAQVDMVAQSDGTTITDFYRCTNHADFTDALAPDDYDVFLQLLDSA